MIERHIDYLQFSALFSEQAMREKGFEDVPAPRFYARGYRDALGIRYYFGNPNTKKALVICSGDALQGLRDGDKLDAEILTWALEAGAEFSRLDLAVTQWISESLFLVEDVKNWYKKGLVESALTAGGGKALVEVLPEREETLETFYIGDWQKRAKRGIFRAYDKGIDLGIGSEIATRIELELKRDKAQKAALRIAETNDIAGNFRAYFEVKHEVFNELMEADAVTTKRGKGREKTEMEEKMDGRWQWLMTQVAPALKDAHEYDMKHHPESRRFYWFLRESGMTHEQIKRMVAEIRELWENSY